MHHACNHAIGASSGFTGGAAPLVSGFGPLGSLGTMAMLFAGLLAAVLLLLWLAGRRPARAGFGAIADGERWREAAPSDQSPRVTYARYDQSPPLYQVPYEQPQAHYPEMPFDGPRTDEPGLYD